MVRLKELSQAVRKIPKNRYMDVVKEDPKFVYAWEEDAEDRVRWRNG